MIQRKVSIKRVLTEIEREDLEIPSTDDLSVPEKPRRKTSKVSKEENTEESKTDSVDNDNDGDATEDPSTKVSEVDKNDSEESESPKDGTEQDVQDSQSSTVSGVDDSSQEASGALSKRLRMYKCERCNTQYMGLAMLRQHCRDVHGDQKYYKCHVCGKLFSHPSSRNIHLRLHSGEKPYKCSTCGKQFRVSSHLKDHVRVHTGERPYICDICQKGFKQSSDLKKHRRTHTLDKPYKCPICPSAFTRSHHCRGHINSVHKFFKCACSALFTSEEAFERHKELHPSIFPEQGDGEETPPEVSDSAQKGIAPKDNTQEENELHEKNLKLDVANQLLELHKIMQHRSSPGNNAGSGSETLSDSGDEGNSNNHSKQSPPSSEVKLVRPQPAATVSPVLRYENDSNRRSPNMSQREQASILLPKITSEGVEFHVPQASYCYSSQSNPQAVDYLRLPFQSISLAGNGKPSPQRKVGHVSVPSLERLTSPPSPERRKSPPSPQRRRSPPSPQRRRSPASPQRRKSPVDQSINGIHSAVHDVPQHAQCMQPFVMNVDPQSQNGNYSIYIENNLRAANSPRDSVEVSKTAESVNTVPCHRVSVIQYHSSAPKPANDARSEESSVQGTLQECDYKLSTLALSKPAPRTLANKPSSDQQQNHHVPQNYNLTMNNLKYLVGIPPEQIPYVPHNAESAMILQSWSKGMNEQVGKYPWALKEEKIAREQFLMRKQALQFSYPKPTLESSQLNVFSHANAQSSRSLYNVHTSQERSVNMLKYLEREQTKPKDAERDTGSPPDDDDSETSEASESGDVPSERKLSGNGDQLSPSSDSLAEQKDSSDSSVHHCEVCNKTFSRSSLLKQHSVIHMGNKRFKFRCEVCGKMFRTRSHLRDHMRIHTGERPFKCHICQKAFKQSSDLKKHINLHTGANQFKCEECNMEFRRADALRKHKLGHKVGNMPCGHCGKNFLHIGALRAHRAMHNVQPVKANRSFHRCNYCFKTFTKAESYKVHIEEHTREQGGAVVLFDCKICSMKFFTDIEFQDHMNIHNGNRPYKCFVCDKEFCIAEHLQDHVRLHSDATSRVGCEEGSNRFQMPDNLMRHSAIHA